MKLFIASDLHGSAPMCRKMLDRFVEEGADKILLLGDILYHGPRNDLPDGYAPKEVAPMLNARKGQILCVRGNCDAEVDQMVLEFPLMNDYLLLEIDGLSIFATHGHQFSPDHVPNFFHGGVLMYGHTHLHVLEKKDGLYVINPGSVTLPKGGNEKTYMIYENKVVTLKTIEGRAIQSLVL